MKKKKFYEQPQSAVTQVELESPICSGSVDITAQSPHGAEIEAQEVNTDFAKDNDFTSTTNSGNAWQ